MLDDLGLPFYQAGLLRRENKCILSIENLNESLKGHSSSILCCYGELELMIVVDQACYFYVNIIPTSQPVITRYSNCQEAM